MRLAIITTHPIQYYAPVFKLLSKKIDLMVFYTWGEGSLTKHDPGFGKTIQWDIDLLEGYQYKWVHNKAVDAGTHHFNGIDNPNLINQINNWRPDSILVYGWAFKSHLSILRYFKNKIPVLFRGDSTLLDEKPGIKNLLRAVYLRWVYKHVDYALYTGSNNKTYFKKYGIKDEQLVFVPHTVDNERFAKPRTAEVSALKQQLNISDNAIIVLFAGKLEHKKDPGLLLKSFTMLDAANVHLLFIGNGVLEKSLKQQAADHPNIHFMDFQNQTDMPVIYQACDVYCLPSAGPGETWGLAVNEAMACAKAVLVSDKVGCATDLVENNGNGYIHTATSFIDLHKKLSLLIGKQKPGLVTMGQKSAQIIKNWTLDTQVNNMVNYKK